MESQRMEEDREREEDKAPAWVSFAEPRIQSVQCVPAGKASP